MKKIAMFGGTFDPIHNGHISLAVQAAKLLCLDRVLLIPTNIPPHKQMHAAPGYHRLAMCRLAAQGRDFLMVSDRELRREGPSFTVDTLHELWAEYPDAKLYLILGSDMFFTLEQWRESEEILRLAVICPGAREPGEFPRLKEHAQHLRDTYGAACEVLDMVVQEISSTEIREKLAKGEDLSAILPEQVLGYIREHYLYRETEGSGMTLEEITQRVKSLLKPKRFVHSCNVARLARELAEKNGADADKAYLAGIIHDVCKNMPEDEQFTIARNSDIIWDNAMMASPQLWHAPAGRRVCKTGVWHRRSGNPSGGALPYDRPGGDGVDGKNPVCGGFDFRRYGNIPGQGNCRNWRGTILTRWWKKGLPLPSRICPGAAFRSIWTQSGHIMR